MRELRLLLAGCHLALFAISGQRLHPPSLPHVSSRGPADAVALPRVCLRVSIGASRIPRLKPAVLSPAIRQACDVLGVSKWLFHLQFLCPFLFFYRSGSDEVVLCSS